MLIQRSRWANGGLLIIPKLVRHALTQPLAAITIPSFLVRLYYLSSIATSSIGMLILLLLPVDAALFSIWLMVPMVAYGSMYWRDLLQSGYRPGDVLRVAALNLMLIPVNLAGVLKSMQQGATGIRTPFARTPKVEGRTAAPAWAVVSLWLLMTWAVVVGVVHIFEHRWLQAVFSLVVAAGFGYATLVLVGPGASWEDATRAVRARVGGLSPRRARSTSLDENPRHW